MSWLTNWEEAKRHPWRSRAFSLGLFTLCGMLISLFMGSIPWLSRAVVALGFGVIGVAVGERAMKEGAESRRRESSKAAKRLAVQFGVLLTAIALALALRSLTVLVTGAAVAVVIQILTRTRWRP